jgi:hypothetical protein
LYLGASVSYLLPLLHKSAGDVIIGLKLAQELLPFPLLGVDTDNGSELINHDLMNFLRRKQNHLYAV